MNLEYISNKLNSILNSVNNPLHSSYHFFCATEGYFLDSVADLTMKKNIIPVFIGSYGGEINPIPDLGDVTHNVKIFIYFPINFKNDFYKLNDFFVSEFVGKQVDFGHTQGELVIHENAICTVSVPQYNTIADAGLSELKSWTKSIYGLDIDTATYWMSMELTLYLHSVNGLGQAGSDDYSNTGFIMGNEVKVTSVVIKHWSGNTSTTVLTETNPIIIQRVDVASSEPAVQQLFSDTHSKGFGANSGYTKQLPLIIRNTTGYRTLLDYLESSNKKDIQNLSVEVTETLPFTTPLSVTNTYFITNYTRSTEIGELLGINLTLADRR